MRNQQQRSRKGFQESAQPLHRRNVQIVGRFVEHQDIRLRNQHPRQRGAHPPAPGKGTQRPVEIRFVKTEVAERLFRFGPEPVSAEVLDLRLKPSVAGQHRLKFVVVVHTVVKLLLQPVQLLAHGAQLGNRVAGEIQQRPGRLAFGQMLPKHPEPVVLRQRNRSPVGLDISGDDAEKRTFASSVRTDHADPVAGIDPECDSVQNRISGIILDYIFKIDHFFPSPFSAVPSHSGTPHRPHCRSNSKIPCTSPVPAR